MSQNRWSLGFFFALVAFPFVIVWAGTQGARTLDALMPVYEVIRVEQIAEFDLGLYLRGVHIEKHARCKAEGIMYVSAEYSEGHVRSEVLIPAERSAGVPYTPQTVLKTGERLRIEELRIVASKDLLHKSDRLRLVIPCDRPLVGPTHAYTNPVWLR